MVDLQRDLWLEEQRHSYVGPPAGKRRPVNLTVEFTDARNVVGSVLAYVFYWLTAIVLLVYLKWKEVRHRSEWEKAFG
jgi:hypothetical protein